MIKTLFTLLLIPLCYLASASQTRLDSLYAKRDTARQMHNAIDAGLQISRLIMDQDPDSAQSLNLWCEEMAKRTGDSVLLALAYEAQGTYFNSMNRYEKGYKVYNKAIVLFSALKDHHKLGAVYNSAAVCQRLLGNYDKSIDLSLKSVEEHQKADDKIGVASAYNNIAIVHYYQGNINKTLSFFKQALATYEAAGDTGNAAKLMANIGIIYKNKGDFDTALDYYMKTADYMKRKNNFPGMARIYHNIGGLYQNKKEPAKALEYMNKSLGIWRNLDNKRGIAEGYLALASFYQSQKQYDMGYAMALKGLNITKEIKLRESEKEAYKTLSEILRLQGKYRDALDYYIMYSQLKDSLHNEENTKNIAKMQAQFESVQKEKENELLRQKDALNKIRLEKQESELGRKTLQIWMAAGGAVILLFLVLFVLRSNRNKQLANRMLAVKNKIIAEKNKDITASIQYARRIQSAILPPHKLVKEYLHESFILYKPKDIVAGDFYWMETIKTAPPAKGNHPVSHSADTPPLKGGENHPGSSSHPSLAGGECVVYFAAADCTGHGVPGAMVSVVCNNALNRTVREYGLTDPGQILDKARELVVAEFEKSEEDVKDGMDIALCALQGHTLQYAGANNPLWLIRKNEDGTTELIEVKPDKQPIGKYAEAKPFTTHHIELQQGDSIYIFSDGFADQFGGPKGKKLKSKPFKQLLLSIQDYTMEEQQSIIDQKFEEWKGSFEQIDDVCVIGVRL